MRYVMKLDVADLAATRFTTSPLGETIGAVRLLGNPRPPGVNLPWVRWARREPARRPGGGRPSPATWPSSAPRPLPPSAPAWAGYFLTARGRPALSIWRNGRWSHSP